MTPKNLVLAGIANKNSGHCVLYDYIVKKFCIIEVSDYKQIIAGNHG